LKIVGDIAKKVQARSTTLGHNERVIILNSRQPVTPVLWCCYV